MKLSIFRVLRFTVLTTFLFLPSIAAAEHLDILLSMDGNGKLIAGQFDDTTESVVGEGPTGVYEFDVEANLPGPYGSNDPGIQSVPQVDLLQLNALPNGARLSFDTLPVSIGNTVSSLYYWDGVGDVSFAPDVANNILSLELSGASVSLNGGQTTVQDGLDLATVNGVSDEPVHLHLGTTIAKGGVSPDDGFYLIALEFALDEPGTSPSDPVYLVYATLGPEVDTLAELEAIEERHERAALWVEQHVVNASTLSVPEPGSLILILIGMSFWGLRCRRRRR